MKKRMERIGRLEKDMGMERKENNQKVVSKDSMELYYEWKRRREQAGITKLKVRSVTREEDLGIGQLSSGFFGDRRLLAADAGVRHHHNEPRMDPTIGRRWVLNSE